MPQQPNRAPLTSTARARDRGTKAPRAAVRVAAVRVATAALIAALSGGSALSISPPASATAPGVHRSPSTLEVSLFDLANAARREAGLDPLRWEPRLHEVARSYAERMIAGGFFGHLSPDGGSPVDRARAAGLGFQRLGENLAGDASVEHAHRMLMRSPWHGPVILDGAFSRAGFAVVPGGPYGLMIVELFAGGEAG